MQGNQSNPLGDRRTIVAVVLVMVVMFGWQFFLSKKYPQPVKPAVAPAAPSGPKAPDPVADATVAPPETPATIANLEAQPPTKTFKFEDDRLSFTITSRGMGLVDYRVKSHRNALGEFVHLGLTEDMGLFELRSVKTDRPIEFDLTESAPGQYVGIGQWQGMEIRREVTYRSADGAFDSRISIKGINVEAKTGLALIVPEKIRRPESSSFFLPSYDHQDFWVSQNGKTQTVNINHSTTDISQDLNTVSLASIGDQYFTSAVMDQSEILPNAVMKSKVSDKAALLELVYKPEQTSGDLNLSQVLYAGSKSIDVLKKIDPKLAGLIDFGFLEIIAKPLLYVMKWFHTIVLNWGLAIIFSTLFVRVVVLPLHMASYRSMKAMQTIQPQLTKMREQYKDDPMTMHRETMALMKANKANPIGGCLPMLLQIPVFFAWFRVVGSSVELYQSPFIGWIHDLSVYDPFYVLPILVGVTMYFQQKLTPTPMDPAQAKIMQFLPIIFTVFMLHVPAGLALYMFVSGLFGVTQQWFIMRGKKTTTPALAS